MIVLDTNVVSELMRAEPDPTVADRLRALPQDALATTTITVGEILYGIRRLEAGRRRSELERRFQELMLLGFRRRLLQFDEAAAAAYAGLMADRSRIGRSIEVLDAMIAGIAVSRGAQVATRNVRHFVECGIQVIDPWMDESR
jgi:toxin FitB